MSKYGPGFRGRATAIGIDMAPPGRVVTIAKSQAVGKSEQAAPLSVLSMPAEVNRPPQNFSGNSRSRFRVDALNLAPFPKGRK